MLEPDELERIVKLEVEVTNTKEMLSIFMKQSLDNYEKLNDKMDVLIKELPYKPNFEHCSEVRAKCDKVCKERKLDCEKKFVEIQISQEKTKQYMEDHMISKASAVIYTILVTIITILAALHFGG